MDQQLAILAKIKAAAEAKNYSLAQSLLLTLASASTSSTPCVHPARVKQRRAVTTARHVCSLEKVASDALWCIFSYSSFDDLVNHLVLSSRIKPHVVAALDVRHRQVLSGRDDATITCESTKCGKKKNKYVRLNCGHFFCHACMLNEHTCLSCDKPFTESFSMHGIIRICSLQQENVLSSNPAGGERVEYVARFIRRAHYNEILRVFEFELAWQGSAEHSFVGLNDLLPMSFDLLLEFVRRDENVDVLRWLWRFPYEHLDDFLGQDAHPFTNDAAIAGLIADHQNGCVNLLACFFN